MKRLRKNKLALFVLFISAASLLAQSCSTAKGCGCGSDINRAYKPKRFH